MNVNLKLAASRFAFLVTLTVNQLAPFLTAGTIS
jgi:hypothetical protein